MQEKDTLTIEPWIGDANRAYRRERAEFDAMWGVLSAEHFPPPERNNMGAGYIVLASIASSLVTILALLFLIGS